ESLLVCENLFAQLLVAVVEQVHLADLVDPFLGRLMRVMRRARYVVNKEWLVRVRSIDSLHVTDGVIRHVGNQIVTGFADPRINWRVITEQIGRPLVGLAAHESIKILEAHPAWPLVERTAGTVLKRRRIVVFAEPRRSIAVVREDPADGRVFRSDNGVITWEASSHLADLAKADRVMVTTSDERCARGGTQSGRMKLRVTKSGLGNAIEGRHGNHATERARHTVARVVGHDQQHVRCAFWGYDLRRPPRLGVFGLLLNYAAE